MKFLEVPRHVLIQNGTNFRGRAARSEYWWFKLWSAIYSFFVLILSPFLLVLFPLGLVILWIAPLVPTTALEVRRLHDTDRSGWWIAAPFGLIALGSLMTAFSESGGIILVVAGMLLYVLVFIWTIQIGTSGTNRFGTDPLEEQSNGQVPPISTGESDEQVDHGTTNNPPLKMPNSSVPVPAGDQWIDATKTVVDATVLVESAGGAGTAFHMGDGVFFSAAHVVAGRTSVRLRNHLIDTEATVVKIHQTADVAQLQADRGLKGLGSLSWGLADNVREGQQVRIAGYPLDVEHKSSVTAGIISKILIEPDGRYFITDAAVNQGNSGGPLFTQDGRIIGIVTSKKIGIAVEGVAMATAENTAKQALESEGLSPAYLTAESILSRNATIRLAMYTAARDGNLTTEDAEIIKDWASSNLPPGTGVSEKERLNEVIKKAFADAVAGELRLEEITHRLQVEGSQEDRDEAIRLVAELITGSANGTAQDGLLTTITELLK
jgi:uncharacterized membrane protein YhaH (DUF805 family)